MFLDMEAMRKATIAAHSHVMNVGQLQKKLQEFNKDAVVTLDCGGIPGNYLWSYRGYYDHVAIHRHDEKSEPTFVKDLLYGCKCVIGSTVTGYKGGEFRIYEYTPVWVVENMSDASYRYVDDVIGRSDGTVLIVTAMQKD